MLMKATAPYATFETQSGTIYTADGNGLVTVATGDVVSMLNMGCVPSSIKSRLLNCAAIVTAALTQVVANVAVTNVALTIAAQTDIARQLVTTMAPGAAAVTAGILTLIYKDQNGVTQTEVQSLVTGSGVTVTAKTVKACAVLVSATVSGFVGGSSPTIEIGTNATVGLPGEAAGFGYTVFKETSNQVDVATLGAVDGVNGLYTLTTAPNSSKLIVVAYTYN